MLIPRFSVRWLLGLTTFSALVSLVLSYAVRGQPWALGITAGLWCLVVVFVLHVASFLAAWLLSQAWTNTHSRTAAAKSQADAGDNPFAPLIRPARQHPVEDPPAITG